MIKKTSLYDCHVRQGGKFVDFTGFSLPVSFEGLIKEHLAVRDSVGVFDVSHMGEIRVIGDRALEFIQKTTTNNVATLKDGQVQYSTMCYPDGGIVDDILIHRFDEKHFFLCVNASNVKKDFEWLLENNSEKIRIINESESFAQIAVQGPHAEELMQKLTNIELKSMSRYWFSQGEICGKQDLIIARTGYTGEDGFEIYSDPSHACEIWEAIFEAGAKLAVKPCGLGARDTLRLEVRYMLYGNDIDATTTPLEAGLGWIVSNKKNDFIGRSAMLQRAGGLEKRKLVGIGMVESGIPRKGYEVFDAYSNRIGLITSGTYSPSLKKPIALAYVPVSIGSPDTPLFVRIRGKLLRAKVVKTPFLSGTSLDRFSKKGVKE